MTLFVLKLYLSDIDEWFCTDVTVASLSEFTFQHLCRTLREVAPQADLTRLKWKDAEGDLMSVRNDKVLAVALRKLQRASDGDLVLRIDGVVDANYQESDSNAGNLVPESFACSNQATASTTSDADVESQPSVDGVKDEVKPEFPDDYATSTLSQLGGQENSNTDYLRKHACVACSESITPGEANMACFKCGDVYHLKCTELARSRPQQVWHCWECSLEASDDDNESDQASESSTARIDEEDACRQEQFENTGECSAPNDEAVPSPDNRTSSSDQLLPAAVGEQIDDVPAEVSFPAWLTTTQPRKSPYFPQIDDIVVYFWQGHALYVDAVRKQHLYDVKESLLPYVKHGNTIETQEFCRVTEIQYDVEPYRLCYLKLAQLKPSLRGTGRSFELSYHEMDGVADFLVLKHYYDHAMASRWQPNDEFHAIFADKLHSGRINSFSPLDDNYPTSAFLIVNVTWRDSVSDRLSLWDLELFDKRYLDNVEPRQYSPAELTEFAQVKRMSSAWPEWPLHGRELETQRLLAGLAICAQRARAEGFEDLLSFELYAGCEAQIEYPCHLTTISERLQNCFYRNPSCEDISEVFEKITKQPVSIHSISQELCGSAQTWKAKGDGSALSTRGAAVAKQHPKANDVMYDDDDFDDNSAVVEVKKRRLAEKDSGASCSHASTSAASRRRRGQPTVFPTSTSTKRRPRRESALAARRSVKTCLQRLNEDGDSSESDSDNGVWAAWRSSDLLKITNSIGSAQQQATSPLIVKVLPGDITVESLAEFTFLQLCQTICEVAAPAEADLTQLKWKDSDGELMTIQNDRGLAVALRKLQRANDGDFILPIYAVARADYQANNSDTGNLVAVNVNNEGFDKAIKSGLTGATLFHVQPEAIIRQRNVSSELSASAARSASVANPQLTFTTTPISFSENSSDLAAHRSTLLYPSSVNSTPDVSRQKTVDAAIPNVGVYEDKALVHCKPEATTVAPQMCALCASNQEFDSAQKEGHVVQHLERTGASTNQNPAMFFASIAEMWQRCFPSSETQPCADDVAMETKNLESPKCHVAKKQRKHLRNHITCMLCDEHVRTTCKEEHVWEQHMAGSERFICGSCGNRGTVQSDLEQSCAVLHPDISVDIKPLATSALQYTRQYELCFGTLPSPGGRPQRSSVAGTPAPMLATPEPIIASATISTSLRSSSERRYSTRYQGERHNQTPAILPPAKLEQVERGSSGLNGRQKSLVTARKSKAKQMQNGCSPVAAKKEPSACSAQRYTCQICFAQRQRKNLQLHALSAHYDGPEKIFECSACGYGDNALLHTVVQHVRTQHHADESAHVIDRHAKFTGAIKRCIDTCFPFVALPPVFSASTTENAVNGKVSCSLSAPKARPSKANDSDQAVGSSGQPKNRSAIKPKRKLKLAPVGVTAVPCQRCGIQIVRNDKEKLARHARTHFQHPEKVFACSKCGHGVHGQPHMIVLHIRKHHPGDKSVRLIDRRIKLARKLQECYDACFPGKDLSTNGSKKLSRRSKQRRLSTTSNAAASTAMVDLPGTSGYAAISRDNSDHGEEMDVVGGNESDDEMPLAAVAIKHEQVSSEETIDVIAKVEPVDGYVDP